MLLEHHGRREERAFQSVAKTDGKKWLERIEADYLEERAQVFKGKTIFS